MGIFFIMKEKTNNQTIVVVWCLYFHFALKWRIQVGFSNFPVQVTIKKGPYKIAWHMIGINFLLLCVFIFNITFHLWRYLIFALFLRVLFTMLRESSIKTIVRVSKEFALSPYIESINCYKAREIKRESVRFQSFYINLGVRLRCRGKIFQKLTFIIVILSLWAWSLFAFYIVY